MVQKKATVYVSKKKEKNSLIRPMFIEHLLYRGIKLAAVNRTMFKKLLIAILVLSLRGEGADNKHF